MSRKPKPLNTPVDAVKNSGMQSAQRLFRDRLFVLFHELYKGLLMHKSSVMSIRDDANVA